ncbi:MAG: hypothetical protein KKH51_02120 [Actinobacteria bacterium]|nr:hypothetical protein [Actinomycetota bacterium]
MLAERISGAALVLGLGLASLGVGSAAAADDVPVVNLAIAVPIIVPSSDEPFIDADTLAQYTSAQGILTRELDAVADRPVALGIDPRIIASIRLLGSTAPASALAWLHRLESVSNETFALGYADADVTLQTQGGAQAVLQPETFDFAINPEFFGVEAGSTATPAPNDAAALPTSAEITAWPYTLTGIAWPRDDTVVAADLPLIAASGYTTSIVSSGNVARESASGPSVAVDGSAVLVSDAAVSGALRTAAATVSPAEWSTALGQLSSAVASGGRVQPGTATVVATLDRAIPAVGDRLAETLDALALDPAVQLVPLSQAIGVAPTAATIVDEPQDADRLSRVGQMIQGENAERAFASVASDPAAITSERRLELLTLLSSEWSGAIVGWPDAADAFTTASVELRNSVHLVTSSNFLLVADNDQYLPITVNNALDQTVTVYVSVRSQSSLLVIDEPRKVLEIEAGAQGKVNVPVHSLSNGVVEVDVALASATGVAIGAPVSSEVNVQAGWETPIVIVIAALVVVVFGVGIVRTILRRRKAARSEGTDD